MSINNSNIYKQFEAVEAQVHYVKGSVKILREVYTGLHLLLTEEGITGLRSTKNFSSALIEVISALETLDGATKALMDEGAEAFKTFGGTRGYRNARRRAMRQVRHNILGK